MKSNESRRPLKVRQLGLIQDLASWMSRKNISPNQISLASVGFAFLASLCLFQFPSADDWLVWTYPLLAAVFIQCRLLCNLFDGMVAVEGKKGTASGELFNDIPDRIADPLILVSAGYAVIAFDYAVALGWAAGLLAVMTAYIRVLAVSIGAPADFSGPMAKQHRMAVMTGLLVVTALPLPWAADGFVLYLGLIVIVVGEIVTVGRRCRAASLALEKPGGSE
ncbi:MAG: CDP-alcohol phosphatidyltransferase family protein [Rhodospirillales bacterium]|nr:CDP-alcohol phosphatidyltransferase family protein [Rhodospirillales bacterium]